MIIFSYRKTHFSPQQIIIQYVTNFIHFFFSLSLSSYQFLKFSINNYFVFDNKQLFPEINF